MRQLLIAFALMLVLEGLMPLAAPRQWREIFLRITRMADGQIRFLGLVSLLAGMALFIVVR